MDAEEAEGLRAFALRVVNATSEAAPQSIELDGAFVNVTAIAATWREEERFGFRVRLENGASWLLYYVPELDLWSGFADAGVGPASVKPRRRVRPPSAGGT